MSFSRTFPLKQPLRKLQPHVLVAVVALMLAFAFLGARGIWDPDEGRYTNVGLVMLDSGDWLNPMRNHETGHWTKPPMTYWAIAASVGTFGRNEWAARLPSALSYLACVWLVWLIARRLVPGEEPMAALAFATMLLPFGASQFISTDFLLAALQALAVWAYIESRAQSSQSGRWLLLAGAAFGMAFLTKGPPGLLPVLVILAHRTLVPPRESKPLHVLGAIAVFVVVAAPWFVAVIHAQPDLLGYFLGEEVVDRFASDDFNRNGQWYGWIVVYLPAIVLGTMPWTRSALRWICGLPREVMSWRDHSRRKEAEADVLLAAWLILPLVIFCVARSRMPLYVLPLFVPIALIVARWRARSNLPIPSLRMLSIWVVVLIGLKFSSSLWSTHKDASEWAKAIEARVPSPPSEVVFVEDMARYGLNLYLSAQVEKVSLADSSDGPFNPQFDSTFLSELHERERDVLYVAKKGRWTEVERVAKEGGFSAVRVGSPYRGRIFFSVTHESDGG